MQKSKVEKDGSFSKEEQQSAINITVMEQPPLVVFQISKKNSNTLRKKEEIFLQRTKAHTKY